MWLRIMVDSFGLAARRREAVDSGTVYQASARMSS